MSVLVDEEARSTPERIAGAPAEVTRRLVQLARGGFDFLNLWPAGDACRQRERLAAEVLPTLRA